MSSTGDTNHTSTVDVAGETVDHTSTQQLEKTIENISSHEGKEQTTTDNANGIVEVQPNGLSKDEPVNGAVGIPIKTGELEISSLSVPSDKTTDEIIHDIQTNSAPPPLPSHDEQPKQKEAEKDIIQLDEHTKHKSEGQSEDPEQEIPIFVSGEAKAEDPDDLKYDSAVEVEPVQKVGKPDESAPSTTGEAIETSLPAPEKENTSEQTIDTSPTTPEPAPTVKPEDANQESQSATHGSATESADLPSVSEPTSEPGEAETHTHEEHANNELTIAQEEQAKDGSSTHTDSATSHEAESVSENVAPITSHGVETSVFEPNSATHEKTTVEEEKDIKLEENAPDEKDSAAVSPDSNPKSTTTDIETHNATNTTEDVNSEPSHETTSTDISTLENQSTTASTEKVEPDGTQIEKELPPPVISQNPTTEVSQENAPVSEEQSDTLSTTEPEVKETTLEQAVESQPAASISEIENQVDEIPVEQALTQTPLPTESVIEARVDTTADSSITHSFEEPSETKASHDDVEAKEESVLPIHVTKVGDEVPLVGNKEVNPEVEDRETQSQITPEMESPAVVEAPPTSEQSSHPETEENKVEGSVDRASGEEEIESSIDQKDEGKQDKADTLVAHEFAADAEKAEAKEPQTEIPTESPIEPETKPESKETTVEAVGETSPSSSIAHEVEDEKVEPKVSPLVQSNVEETVTTPQPEEAVAEGAKDPLEVVEKSEAEPQPQAPISSTPSAEEATPVLAVGQEELTLSQDAKDIPEIQSESKAEIQAEEQPEVQLENQSNISETPITQSIQDAHTHTDEAPENKDEDKTSKEPSDQSHEVSSAPALVEVDSGNSAEDGKDATAVELEGLNEETKVSTAVNGVSATEEEKSTTEISDEASQANKEYIEMSVVSEAMDVPVTEPVQSISPENPQETVTETSQPENSHTEETSSSTNLDIASDSVAQGFNITEDIAPILVDQPVTSETTSPSDLVIEAPVVEDQKEETEAVQETTAVTEEQVTKGGLGVEGGHTSKPEPEETTSGDVNTLAEDKAPQQTLDKPDVEEVSSVKPVDEEVSPAKPDVEEISPTKPDDVEVSPAKPEEAVTITDSVTETRELEEIKTPEVTEPLDTKEVQSQLPSETVQPVPELDTKSTNDTKDEKVVPAAEESMAEHPPVDHTPIDVELQSEPVASTGHEETSTSLTKEEQSVIEEPKSEALGHIVEEEKELSSTIENNSKPEPSILPVTAVDEPSAETIAPAAVEELPGLTTEDSKEQPPIENVTKDEEPTVKESEPEEASNVVEDEISTGAVEEGTVEEPPVISATVVEEPVSEAASPAISPPGDAEEVSIPVIEEVTSAQSLVENAAIVEEPVTESVTSAPVFEEMAKEQPPIEHPTTIEEPANEDLTPSDAALAPVQEVFIPVIEELPKEQPPIEHPTTVEEPTTPFDITSTPVQEASIPVIQEVSEQQHDHSAAVEGLVAETVTPEVHDDEKAIKPVTDKISEDLNSVEPVPVVEEPKIESASENEHSTSSIEAATDTLVEQATIIEDTEAQAKVLVDGELEKTTASVIEEAPEEQKSEEKVTSVEESGAEVPSSTVEETETTAPLVEAIDESSVEQTTIVEEPISETVVPVAHEEPIIEADSEKQESVEQTANVEKPATTEDTSTPNAVNDESKEHISPVEKPISDERTETIQEPVTEAVEESSHVVDDLSAIVKPLEQAKNEPETHLPSATSNDNAEESSRAVEAPLEAPQIEPTDTVEEAPDAKQNPPEEEEETSIPKAEIPEPSTVPKIHVAESEPETLTPEAVKELQPSLHEPESTTPGIEESKSQSPPAEAAVEHADEASDPTVEGNTKEEPVVEDIQVFSTVEEEQRENGDATVTDEVPKAQEAEIELTQELSAEKPETDHGVTSTPEESGSTQSTTTITEPVNEEHASPLITTTDKAEVSSEFHVPSDVVEPIEKPSIFGGETHSSLSQTEIETSSEVNPVPQTDVENTSDETFISEMPDEQPKLQEQSKPDAELAAAEVLLSHPISGFSANEVIPQRPLETEEVPQKPDEAPKEVPDIPALVITITEENQPSHGDDFGSDATTSQKDAHELHKVDAEPDQVITVQDTEKSEAPKSEETQKLATLATVENADEVPTDDDYEHISHADAVPDEQESSTKEESVNLDEVPRNITPIPVASETASAVTDSAAILDPTDRSFVSTPIAVASETAAAVQDTALILDPIDRSYTVTPIPVAAETAAAVEDSAATLDPTDRSIAPTPIPVAAETAAAVEDTAALLDPIDRSIVPTPIPVAAETAAAVEDTAATLDPTDRSIAPTPIPVAAETAAAVEDIAATLDIDVDHSKASNPITEAADTAAAVEDTPTIVDPEDKSIVSNPILQTAESVAVVEDTAQTLDINNDLPQSTSTATVPSESPVENADHVNKAEIVSGAVIHSFRESSRPNTPLQETRNEVVDNTPAVDTQAIPTEVIITPPSPVAEAQSSLEVEKAGSTQTSEELNTGSAIQTSGVQTESSTNTSDDVAPVVSNASPSEAEAVESAPKAPPVPEVVIEEEGNENNQLKDNLVLAGAGLAGAALIGGGIYAATRDDKVESVPMARTITNESSKSVHDKPLSFKGDHFLPHMKEVGPQVAETEVHRAEIVRPSSTMLSKSVDAPHDSELLGKEDRKDTDPALKDQLTENPALSKPHTAEAIPEPEPAHSPKGKERAPDVLPKSIEEDDLVDILEASGHLQAPHMQRDPSGSSEFNESLISVDAISEALRYMRENNSDAALRPPDIVVSEETTDGEHKTRNIVEVITPDTELATEGEVRRRDPSTRREQSRPSTRGSDMVSAKHHKNLMENFWKLVFVGWLGGFGKFFVGLFGRKNGEQLGSVYANYAASMRESQQLMSQHNFNFEQHRSRSGKGKEKEMERVTGDSNGVTNDVNGNGVSGGTNGVSNGSSNETSTKVKEGRRGSIKKKWNAYRKKTN